MEKEYNKLTEEYAISARKYFYILRLAIYHVDGKEVDSSYEISQYPTSAEVYEVACRLLKALYAGKDKGKENNMSDNVIYNSDDNITIGYYEDLKAELKKTIEDCTKEDNWEEVKDMADLLLDLNEWADSKNLLVLSDNNGMGYSIREYEKGD